VASGPAVSSSARHALSFSESGTAGLVADE